VLWSITKGSFINKVIILPAVFLLNYFFPVAISFILVAGAFYLAYEGIEKIYEFLFHKPKKSAPATEILRQSPDEERVKIKSAVTTDFILSVEIVIIALGTVLDKSLSIQILTVSVVALLATVGVYGLVALIVRMDDAGYSLVKVSRGKGILAKLGQLLVGLLPRIIQLLSIAGTIALLLVAGGIFNHNIDQIHHLLPGMPLMLKEFLLGLVAGVVSLALVSAIKRISRKAA
ncbi:MAG: DUF808 family protein, partial [Chitinophagaceae bacterium]